MENNMDYSQKILIWLFFTHWNKMNTGVSGNEDVRGGSSHTLLLQVRAEPPWEMELGIFKKTKWHMLLIQKYYLKKPILEIHKSGHMGILYRDVYCSLFIVAWNWRKRTIFVSRWMNNLWLTLLWKILNYFLKMDIFYWYGKKYTLYHNILMKS